MIKLFQYRATFFGLPADYKSKLYDELFTLVYYGGGGFTIKDVYDLPVEQRRYFLLKLREAKEKEQESIEKQSKKNASTPRMPKHYR